jgi:hypothetical protein
MAITNLTAQRLRELVHYDPETGVFRRIGRSRYNSITGGVAGSPHSRGYLHFTVDNVAFFSHRLAWLYVTGEWPTGQIDHINGDKTDNRWSNLRDVDGHANQQNRKTAWGPSSTGFVGVTARPHGFVAQIRIAGKQTYIGSFRTAEAAHAAYLEAKRKHQPGYVP